MQNAKYSACSEHVGVLCDVNPGHVFDQVMYSQCGYILDQVMYSQCGYILDQVMYSQCCYIT